MKNTKMQILFLTVAFFVVGIFIMAAIRTANMPVRQINTRNEVLISDILDLEAEIADLEEYRRLTNEKITAIHEEQIQGESQLSLLSQSLENLRQSAALTELQGPGLIITIDDNKEGAEKARFASLENYFPENYIVHDKDLLYLVRAVAPDSEAIAINNVRLNNNSHIRCAGTVILVNYAIMAPPYEIRIIGDPEKLLQNLQNSSRYRYLQSKMMPIKAVMAEELTLPGYSGGYVLNYSKPVK